MSEIALSLLHHTARSRRIDSRALELESELELELELELVTLR